MTCYVQFTIVVLYHQISNIVEKKKSKVKESFQKNTALLMFAMI